MTRNAKALYTAILVFVVLLAMDALRLWPGSLIRAALVAGVSSVLVSWLGSSRKAV